MNLCKTARDQPCFIRVPNVCNGNPATVVLCHFRQLGISGMGMKSPDVMGAFGCSACHDAVDGRSRTDFSRDELQLMHARAVFRTQNYWIEHNYLKW